MSELYFVTSNQGKIEEAQAILGFPIKIAKIEIDEIQSIDIETIVNKKAQTAFEILKKPLIVDDAGLYIETWNNFPGPFIKYVLSMGGIELLLKMLKREKNRKAYFKAAIGFHDGKIIHVFTGQVNGLIALNPRGGGWGFDPIFIVENTKKTFGEMSKSEKNSVSHRRRALDKLKKFLLHTS